MQLTFQDVTFVHDQALEPLFSGVSIHFAQGWTGIIGPNGSGKSTLLRLACGEFRPHRGIILAQGRVVYCAQRTDEVPPLLGSFFSARDREACRLRGRLVLGEDWPERWDSLSHGEQKRAQIAVALWQEPELLAIDEPTNHIDAAARRLLLQILAGFGGVGLLVSHDRELLDSLCRECLFIEPPLVVPRPGGYTQASELARTEQESEFRQRHLAEKALDQLEREARNRGREAARADKMRSRRAVAPKDHDAKERINRARTTGKDGQAGRLANQLQGRVKHLRQELGGLRIVKEHKIGVWLPESRSRRDTLFALPEGSIPLGGGRSLRHPELRMGPHDRVALTGPNGAGKSTLVAHLIERLEGSGIDVAYLPQEIGPGKARDILAQARGLPGEELGRVMTMVSRLGSRPERLLQTIEPSPGELRKIHLALEILRAPQMVILDEPTNHLDLPAIECLEEALADWPLALLLVSHDFPFLRRLAQVRWDIEDGRLGMDQTWGRDD